MRSRSSIPRSRRTSIRPGRPDVAGRYQLYINGRYREGDDGDVFADVSPVDGETVSWVSRASEAQVEEAIHAARAAQPGWARLGAVARADILRRAAALLSERFDAFLEAEVRDTGKPVSLARTLDVPRGAANFRTFADLAATLGTQSYQTATDDGRGALQYVVRAPVGVVAVICPWNLPLLLMTWKVAPALAAGNAVVVKPSSETPGTATLLAQVLQDAGVPPGVYNVVHGPGREVGDALVRHPEVDAVTFTGESRTGQAIMAAAAPRVKPLSFELGGKNAALVFADCDFDAAVAGTVRSVFANTGQVCLCTERVYIERPIFNRFVSALKLAAKDLRMGDPWQEGVTTGPLISRSHRDKVLSYYKLAQEEGAQVVLGGGVPSLGPKYEGGAYVEPTLWVGLSETARCVREEVFGPVAHLAPFDTEEEAIALANHSEYGLAGVVWTKDLARAHRVAAQLAVGISWVNCWFLRDLRTPFGGIRLSGIGREGGEHSLNFYSELKTICVKL